MIGLDLTVYGDSEDDVEFADDIKGDATATFGYALFSVGGDLFVSYKFKPNFGIFCNVSGRYLVAGGTFGEIEFKYKENGNTHTYKDDYDLGDLRGKFRVQPTIGVVWIF